MVTRYQKRLVEGEGMKSKRDSRRLPTRKIKLGRAHFCILIKDYKDKHFFPFGMTCSNELFTISLGTCTVKVNRVNFNSMLNLI